MANTCKYQKLQRYVSYDSGATWQPLNEFQRGALIEADSPDCGGGTIFYRWVEMPSGTSYVCVGYDKYTKEKKQQSYDNVNWEDVVPAEYRQGTLIEHNSEDCGFVPPQPTGNTKWVATYSGGTYLTGECDSTSAITSQNCPPNYNGNNPCIELAVGDCVTTIRIQSWSNGEFMYVSSVTLSNSVTTLDVGAFEHFSGLTSIVIPDSVTTIGDLAFYLCTSLSSVTIGSGVTSIGDASFNRCNLDEIVIPNNVVTIGEQAFCNSGIKSATIGSGVTSIGGDAFSQNPNLSSITITALVPPTLESYGVFDYTNDCPIFVPCDSLSIYKSTNRWSDYSSRLVGIPPCGEIQYRWYPSGTTCIGVDKYQNNIKQKSYDSGQTWENVSPPEYSASTVIEYNSEDCGYVPPTPVEYRWYPSGYTCIGYDKWQNNIKQQSTDGGETWTNVSPPEYSASTVIEYNSEDCGYVPPTPTFDGKWLATYSDSHTESAECIGNSSSAITSGEITSRSAITTFEIGQCVKRIGRNAFDSCTSLTSITIPSSVTSINYAAFNNCASLTSITIPDSVTSISTGVFEWCEALTSVSIGSGVTAIEQDAFWACPSLTSMTITAPTPPFIRSNSMGGTYPIYVPSGSVETYKSAYKKGWSEDMADRIQPIPNS